MLNNPLIILKVKLTDLKYTKKSFEVKYCERYLKFFFYSILKSQQFQTVLLKYIE